MAIWVLSLGRIAQIITSLIYLACCFLIVDSFQSIWTVGAPRAYALQATAHFMSSAIQSQPKISGTTASAIHQISTVICRLIQRLQAVLQSRRYAH